LGKPTLRRIIHSAINKSLKILNSQRKSNKKSVFKLVRIPESKNRGGRIKKPRSKFDFRPVQV